MKMLILCVTLTLAAACSGDKFIGTEIATLEASVAGRPLLIDGTLTVSPAALAPGVAGAVAELAIINTGERALDIDTITIVASPPGAFTLASDPVALTPLDVGPYTVVSRVADGPRALLAYLVLDRGVAGDAPTAVISITSNSVNHSVAHRVIEFHVALDRGAPALATHPERVDFGAVARDEAVARPLGIINTGNAPLVIEGFALSGHANFAVTFPGHTPVPVSAASGQGVTFEAPLVVEAQGTIELLVTFFAGDPDPARGQLVLATNDPVAPDTIVPLQANIGAPCITVDPPELELGGKLVGKLTFREVTITSCGDQPLTITDIVMTARSSDELTLELDELAGVDGATSLAGLPPLVLASGERATFRVGYAPAEESPHDTDGAPIRDTAVVSITTPDAFITQTDIAVSGFGVIVECPTAIIVADGLGDEDEVVPQTRVKLIGSQSYAATGGIADYEWSVSQPAGSVSALRPSAGSPTPTFELNVAGEYHFRLDVIDAAGVRSCVADELTLYVVPRDALHVELVWRTPGDGDETDEGPVAGSDLDLHVVHPLAQSPDVDGDGRSDGWFDAFHDCYWFNPHPNWASHVTDVDDPALDRDDVDGGGPENMNLDAPEAGACYRVGVHYWDDHDFGAADATVRVYVYGALVYETAPVTLRKRDLWEVTSICWPLAGEALAPTRVCEGTHTGCTRDADCDAAACVDRVVPGYVPAGLLVP